MRLGLSDVPKTITRRGGQRYLVPHLLRPGERARELAALIELYESWLGRERSGFPVDRPAELLGDYRLARCLETCLGEEYIWQSPPWPGSVSGERAGSLAARGILLSSSLRLALYDFVNQHEGGYLSTARRDDVLTAFAAALDLDVAALDDLLYLDADARAVLTRVASDAPSPASLAARYNQRAFEAMLGGAARIELTIGRASAGGSVGVGEGEGLGTTVKRICFLARTMGVQYDVAFDTPAEAAPAARTPASMVTERPAAYRTEGTEGANDTARADAPDALGAVIGRGPLIITLYGPQEMTGGPAQYGDRLARLCRVLLGYRRRSHAGRAALAGAEVSGTAVVYLHGRPLLFALDDRLMRLIGAAPEAEEALDDATASSAPDFDSGLERAFSQEFAALDAAGEAHGWRLEREPEPVVVDETILVPDFALTRGPRRIYLEIAGYWRPDYRERKLRKLLAVRDRVALAVAAPESARDELAAAARLMPFLWYRSRVSAQGLISLLERAYDDRERRLAALDPPRVLDEVARRGRIPPAEAYAALRCYTRNELAGTLERVRAAAGEAGNPPPEWIEGAGLCGRDWLDAVHAELRGLLDAAPDGRVPLAEARMRLDQTLGMRDVPDETVEALARLAGLVVRRDSIFEAYIARPGGAPPTETATSAAIQRDRKRQTQPRGSPRRKQSVASLSVASTPSLFSPESTGPDDAEADTPTRATNTTSKEVRRGR